jgi:hypothetical protein
VHGTHSAGFSCVHPGAKKPHLQRKVLSLDAMEMPLPAMLAKCDFGLLRHTLHVTCHPVWSLPPDGDRCSS